MTCIPDHIWQLLETLDDLRPSGLEADSVFGHDQGEHGEGEHLTGVGLGRGHTNLGAGIDVDTTMRLTTDGGTHLEVLSSTSFTTLSRDYYRVGYTHNEGTSGLAVPAKKI